MTTGITIDGYTLPEIQQIIQSINADADVGTTTGGYNGEASGKTGMEESIATAKTGVMVAIYDPELAAVMTGEI